RDFLAKQVSAVRQDRGDACAYAVAFDDRGVTYGHPRNISDRVQRACREHTNNHSSFTRTRTFGLLSTRHDAIRKQADDYHYEDESFHLDHSHSVAHSAIKAGIASHRSPLTRKNRKPKNPRRLIQVFTSMLDSSAGRSSVPS